MAIGLLGGLALAGGLKYGRDLLRDRRQSMLDQQLGEARSALLADPYNPEVQMQYRQIAQQQLPASEIDKRMGIAQQVGPYADKPAMLQAEKSMRGETSKVLAPFQQAIQYYNEAAQIKGGDVEKWTGTDDFAAIRKFIKQSLPNESVMGDDMNNLKFSQGVPEYVKSWIQSLMGKGALSVEGRQALLMTMENEARTRAARRDEIREYQGGLAEQAGLQPSNVMMPPQAVMPLPFSPEVQAPANPYVPPPDDMYEYRINTTTGKVQRRKR